MTVLAVVEALLRCGMWASLLMERWTEESDALLF